MKKIIALLTVMLLVLAVSAAFAEDVAALTDRELMDLYREVLDEMDRRGITYTEEPVPYQDAAVERLKDFMEGWYRMSLDELVEMCTSEWKAEVENPRTALFGILANRTPMSYTLEKVHDAVGDAVCTAEITARMDRHNNKEPKDYHFSMILKKEADGLWYVEPTSLQSFEYVSNPATPEPEPTAAPTETPAEETGETVLYYHPDGGSYYHLDENCRMVNPKFLPLQGMFKAAELNDEAYRNLKPCPVCGAPARDE